MVSAPVQQIEIDAIGAQPFETALARLDRACQAGIPGIDLADDENLVAPAPDRLADDLFCATVAVHFGGVDQRHAEIDAGPQAFDLRFGMAGILAHRPGSLAERRHFYAVREGDCRNPAVLHDLFHFAGDCGDFLSFK